MSWSRLARTGLLIVMDVLVVVAALVTARAVVRFFGAFASLPPAKMLIAITNPLVALSVGTPIKTPYGGILDVPAVVLVVVLLAIEWALGVIRRRV